MSTQVQYRRGTNAQNAAFTGALAEITVDTTNGTLRVHDGITAGGSNIATVAYVTAQIGALSANSISSGTSNVRVVSSGGNVTTSVGGNANVLVITSTGANIAGTLNATGNANVGNLGAATVVATTLTGTLSTAAQTSITSVGTLGALTVTGNVTGGNLVTAGQVSATGNVTGGNLIGTIRTAAQTSITSVGTLGALTVTGNVTGGNLITAGLVSLSSITKTGSNGVGNIGSSTSTFNTIFAKATSAQYADLAEMYVSDADYAPGTVVEFGGEYEITISTHSHSTAVAGIVSTNPSYLMNSTQAGEHVLPVALTGRVPCQVLGPVRKGDVLVASSTPGVAQRIGMNWQPGCVVGKSMESIDTAEIQTIEVAVGRL
jgi:hypothetical protein